jgi:hypothetical protein
MSLEGWEYLVDDDDLRVMIAPSIGGDIKAVPFP